MTSTSLANQKNPCPCRADGESTPSLANCLLPYIQGKAEPESAEQLLRARYTAFTLGEVDFIIASHHSKTRKDVSRDEVASWSKDSKWLGLEIVQKEAGEAKDSKGTIVFCARYESEGKPQEHWEQAIFERDPEPKGPWRFLDARGVQVGTYRRTEPKVGRNDPCPCGSGKKYKKCHGLGT